MLEQLSSRPIVPVIVIDDAEDAEPLAEALLEGGIDVAEVTFRTAAAADAIERMAKRFPEMLVGAGTVLTIEQADRAMNAGATFGVAPGLNPEIVSHFQKAGKSFMPGVMTPTEIERGLGMGLTLLKFFPAGQAGGVNMLKALAGPYANSGVKFCPTGGVSKSNMMEYLSLPVVATIGGSWIATKQQIADKDWAAITTQAGEALTQCSE